jgi:hypothetical protein
MPKEIIEFYTIEDAASLLKSFSDTFSYPVKKISKERIITTSVSSNIFRAFSNHKIRPSVIYREWAKDNFTSILIDFQKIDSRENYYDFVFKYADSLIKRWAEKTANPDNYLIYGPATKMINVLIKKIQQSDEFCQREKFGFIQVPFDRFFLQPLRPIINELSGLSFRINIPREPTMKFINTPQLYRIIMDSVYRLCDFVDIDPLVYDYWCWNEKH